MGTKFNSIYWNTACLIINSGIDEDFIVEEAIIDDDDSEIDDDDYETVEENIMETEEEVDEDKEEDLYEQKKEKNTNTKYGKIAAAIGKFKQNGIKVSLPDINTSNFTFTPDAKTNTIYFGFKGIVGINNDLIKTIISNRPYNNLSEVLAKVPLNVAQGVNLIKSGAMDCFGSRQEIMKEFLTIYAAKQKKLKKQITVASIPTLNKYGLIPEEFQIYRKIHTLVSFARKMKKTIVVGEVENHGVTYKIKETYYVFNEQCYNFFINIFPEHEKSLVQINLENKNETALIKDSLMESIYKSKMEEMKKHFLKPNTKELLEELNKLVIDELCEKYCKTDVIEHWEVESVGFYGNKHELEYYKSYKYYDFKDFYSLPEVPIPLTTKTYKYENKKTKKYEERTYSTYDIVQLCGTVISRDNSKNIVTILTMTGVVDIKFWKESYTHWNKRLSQMQPSGKKKIMEKSWFEKGEILVVTGFRRDNNFFPKNYKNSDFDFDLAKVKVNKNGEFEFITKRGEY